MRRFKEPVRSNVKSSAPRARAFSRPSIVSLLARAVLVLLVAGLVLQLPSGAAGAGGSGGGGQEEQAAARAVLQLLR